ncbi:Phage anti-repressor protein [Modicisalibacter ilicicola DSM 19980]|uniref:Phage anti-repressor protein n=1 Tax=Modicisalibacter ilicicola DSM 19980 TaxID=1121942 RepID=A0A1M4Y0F6_9GAMM|nr:antA/AntB antirepressor family protein [Halomonas ilicicola]SHE99324.1 Phage anti-repressor protein [Halomonas ilicicola DSM 19980]
MNSQLIPVFQSSGQQLLCNARDLHVFLEVGRDFSTWMKDRIDQYCFVEGEDYIVMNNFGSPDLANQKLSRRKPRFDSPDLGKTCEDEFSPDLGKTSEDEFSPDLAKTSKGGRPAIDYHLTMDMAKELAMIENNAMGRRVRRYFIQRERQAIELLEKQATEVQPIEQVKKRIKDNPKFHYLFLLQQQSRTLARELATCDNPNERFNTHCTLRQVNDCLGIPTEPLEKWHSPDTSQPLISNS